jgi:hypothetical protein
VSVARRLECDEDKGRFEAKLRKIALAKSPTHEGEAKGQPPASEAKSLGCQLQYHHKKGMIYSPAHGILLFYCSAVPSVYDAGHAPEGES